VQQVECELTAEKRAVLGKQVKQLREQAWVPGVIYGHGFGSVPLQFEERSLKQVLSQIGGSQLVRINIEGEQPEMALVREVQRDPIRGTLLHVDFYRVMMTERLRTEVPLIMVGESPVVAKKAGILLHGISTIEVECLPGDLVDAIEVDLADLTEVDQALCVRDLAVPAGIEVLADAEEMIVRLVAAKLAEEVEEAAAPEAREVEVIKESREKETTTRED